MVRAIEGLPPVASNWSPGPDMNSLAVLAAHTAGAERYWIGDLVGADPSDRVRDREFMVEAADSTELIRLLDSTLDHSRETLRTLSLDDLDQQVETANGRIFSVSWALSHALEHTAVHTGHMEITRQLWQQLAEES